MIVEYLDPSKYGKEYFKPIYNWYLYYTKDINPSAILCTTKNKYFEDSLHLSIFEVAKHKQNMGLGTFILDNFNHLFSIDKLTLMARNDKLIDFYEHLSFHLIDKDPPVLLRCY
jgi:hypothetical protein